MVTLPKPTQSEFEDAPVGTHLATLYRVVDLGTQETSFGKAKRKIMLSWELPEELTSDGKPFSIHKRYNLSGHKDSELRKDLEAWRGVPFTDEEFDTFNLGDSLIGKGCLLGVVHNKEGEKTYVNISSISRMMKGQEAKPLVNESVDFDLEKFDLVVFDKLSDNLKKTIEQSPEYKAATS